MEVKLLFSDAFFIYFKCIRGVMGIHTLLGYLNEAGALEAWGREMKH